MPHRHVHPAYQGEAATRPTVKGPRHMGKHGKRYQDAAKLVEHGKSYEPDVAMDLLKQTATTKFDGSVEAHIRLGVDPRQGDP